MQKQLRNISAWVGKNLNIVRDGRVSQPEILDREYYDRYVICRMILRCLHPLDQVLAGDEGTCPNLIELRRALLIGSCNAPQAADSVGGDVLLQEYKHLLLSGPVDKQHQSISLKLFKEGLASLRTYRNALVNLSFLEWSSSGAMDQLAECLFNVRYAFYLISNFSRLDDFDIDALRKIAPLYASLCHFFIFKKGSNIPFKELSNANYENMIRDVGDLVKCLRS